MNAITKTQQQRLIFLLLSVFTTGTASFLITPLLPIYFVESIANGGLCWSRADTFSIFGTFLALTYISPFIGGLLGDFVLGKTPTALVGYFLIGTGLVTLSSYTTSDAVSLALIALSLGIGFVKVNLTAAVGRLPHPIRQQGYEYHYVATCMGFMTGGLLSIPLFNAYAIHGVVATTLCFISASVCCFLVFLSKQAPTSLQEPQKNLSLTPSRRPHNPLAFFLLILFGVPFFICSNQLATGMPIFLHQCVNRSFGGWTVPTLWFGAIGSLAMTLISPWLRKGWAIRQSSSQTIEPLKFSAGFTIIASAFAITALFATFNAAHPIATAVPLMIGVHIICFIADFHVRPVLYASATSLMPTRYHTLSTALAYACIGLGGKLSGTLASFVDTIGFPAIFGICSCIALLCGITTFVWWKRSFFPVQGALAVEDSLIVDTESAASTTLP